MDRVTNRKQPVSEDRASGGVEIESARSVSARYPGSDERQPGALAQLGNAALAIALLVVSFYMLYELSSLLAHRLTAFSPSELLYGLGVPGNPFHR